MTTVKPRELPDARRKLLHWVNEYAAKIWYTAHTSGTHYYIPPDLQEMPLPMAFAEMTEREARKLANARLYAVSNEMTYLAAKTGMPKCHLPREVIPSDRGLIVWSKPIGAAEQFYPPTISLDGEVIGEVLDEWYLKMDREAVIPVIAASWEVQGGDVFVWFHTNRLDLARKQMFTPEQYEEWSQFAPPLMYEREQLIPLDREIDWFTSDSDDRLEMTAQSNSGARQGQESAVLRDQKVLPMVEQMTKTLVATWHLMASRMAAPQELPTPPRTRKAERRNGVSPAASSAGVQIIKLGQKIRSQKPKAEEPAYRWKKRRIVGPFTRRQWYPSQGTHKPKLIEPYIAGPEGAPISNAEKVYLLDE
ncbi:hypothetical protein ACIOHC_36385 [Streptomyces sp. NPDC088252]|uniref:hypothetical protein n=1 Tax=Streptomyces sp. NPDC088252 TaxID=3365845 RepID=UPI00380D08F9